MGLGRRFDYWLLFVAHRVFELKKGTSHHKLVGLDVIARHNVYSSQQLVISMVNANLNKRNI